MKGKWLVFFLMTLGSLQSNASSVGIGQDVFFSDSLFVKKKRYKEVVKLSPNPTLNGTVSFVSSLNEGMVQVYIFDLSGTLIHQFTLKAKQKFVLQNLKKGTYVYDVFRNDESIDSGHIISK